VSRPRSRQIWPPPPNFTTMAEDQPEKIRPGRGGRRKKNSANYRISTCDNFDMITSGLVSCSEIAAAEEPEPTPGPSRH